MGLLDSGNSISLLNFNTYECRGKPGSMNAFENKIRKIKAFDLFGSVHIKNPKKNKIRRVYQ